MVRHIRKSETDNSRFSGLGEDLARELQSPRPFGQPVILEDELPDSNMIRVQVLWDRWQDCPQEMRSRTIVEAYKKALGEDYAKKITLPYGLTYSEAVPLGLLPYSIIPTTKGGEDPGDEAYRQAMFDLGATMIDDKPQLRFANIEDANLVYEKLTRDFPKSRWAIVQEVYMEGGS